MATTAVGAEFAIVHVVRSMAITALAIVRFDDIERRAMTRLAIDINMFAFQRKFRCGVVIET